ncbi:MAG: NTPase [archaeon YNP-WB-062]|jgi:nucleoside-triphosphatase|nr:NTPase [Candidatus Culexarchaeum yellowstonense]
MIIVVTGRPGVGKSTICLKVIELLRGSGLRVGGVICPEIREGGVRVGFKVLDLMSGKSGLLAHVNIPSPVMVGKYYVQLKSFEDVLIDALNSALTDADVIVFDEIGPMELKSDVVLNFLSSIPKINKPILMVVHWKVVNNLRDLIKVDYKVFTVTFENRMLLPNKIFNLLVGGV